MTRLRGLMLAGLLLALFPPDTFAQDPPEPIGRFAADLRAAMPNFPDDGAIANAIAVPEDNLPGRGLGLSAGLHVYPLRMGKVTLGIGGELLIARASRHARAGGRRRHAGPDGVQPLHVALAPGVAELRLAPRLELPERRLRVRRAHHRERRGAGRITRRPARDDQLRRRRAVVRAGTPRVHVRCPVPPLRRAGGHCRTPGVSGRKDIRY